MGKLRIIATECRAFQDRREAGRLLGRELREYRGKDAVVLGIPRGGVVVARELAQELAADLDIVISRKLRTPGQPELAAGSVAEDGTVFYNENILSALGINRKLLEAETNIQKTEIARRRDLIRSVLPKVGVKNRVAIVTDDGIATGATTQAALWAVRQETPGYLIAAIPVGSSEAVKRLSGDADEVVCLCTPFYFAAVGQFYRKFDQIEDDEVLKILTAEKERKAAARF